ncbi:hypothetical protein WMY93_001532 [Mugilogobius chulae]|uniref:Nucleoside-diphosphate kinase n=1 Tax=Mugilogobius chulae TaxID=88201 RepID=A0AAW0Q2H6_9GOBI
MAAATAAAAEKCFLVCYKQRASFVEPGVAADDEAAGGVCVGGPGAGKGTQCSKIVENYGYTHLSAGDLLRAERAREDSECGQLIANYIKEGKIVPVQITIELLKKAMEET